MSVQEFSRWISFFHYQNEEHQQVLPEAKDMSGDEIAARLGAF